MLEMWLRLSQTNNNSNPTWRYKEEEANPEWRQYEKGQDTAWRQKKRKKLTSCTRIQYADKIWYKVRMEIQNIHK